jgi:hypothetical protein
MEFNGLNHKSPEASRVTCPECGDSFSSRGLPGHRRMRHGTFITRAGGNEPGAVLPAEKTLQGVEYLPQLVRAFDELLVLLKKLEVHLVRLDEARERVFLNPPPCSETLARSLEHSLGDILAEIARVEAGARERTSALGDTPQSAEQKQLEETTYTEIGKLRRQQAHLLFRLRELRGQDASDALCS